MNNLLNFFSVVSDELRLRIILLLSKHDLCVCQICEILGVPQPKISQHLSKLRDLKFVQDKRQGKWVFYSLTIDDTVINSLISAVVNHANLYSVLEGDMAKLAKIKPCSDLKLNPEGMGSTAECFR